MVYLIIVGVVLYLIFEVVWTIKYGGFIRKDIAHILTQTRPNRIEFASPRSNTLLTEPRIFKCNLLLSKYRTDDYGCVVRWSKLHRVLNTYYKIAEKKRLKLIGRNFKQGLYSSTM